MKQHSMKSVDFRREADSSVSEKKKKHLQHVVKVFFFFLESDKLLRALDNAPSVPVKQP